jgi:hypothetical protein
MVEFRNACTTSHRIVNVVVVDLEFVLLSSFWCKILIVVVVVAWLLLLLLLCGVPILPCGVFFWQRRHDCRTCSTATHTTNPTITNPMITTVVVTTRVTIVIIVQYLFVKFLYPAGIDAAVGMSCDVSHE